MYTGSPVSPGFAPDYGLYNQVNSFMTGQAAMPFQRNLPGYSGLIGQRSLNVGGLLRGEVPADVQYLLQQGAERGVAMGSPGSPNANAAWLRALGLTSLGLKQEGNKQLGEAIGQTPVPQIANPIDLYLAQMKAQMELQAAQAGRGGGSGRNWWERAGGLSSPGFRFTGPSGGLL